MKLVGNISYDANTTTTTNSLTAAMLLAPELMFNTSNLFEKQMTTMSSYLARRDFVKRGLFPDFTSPDFKVVGNRQMKWPLKAYPFRKGKIVGAVTSEAGYSEIGKNGSLFTVPIDSGYFSPNDVLELKDRRTQIIIMNEYAQEVSSGVFHYKAKLVTGDPAAYLPSELVTENSEVGFSHTMFPEMSETGYEKNTYPEWHTEFMSIQRMAWSVSGSAHASVLGLEHNGQKLWTPTQDYEMLERVAYARENSLIFGKATVDANAKVNIRDLKGRDLISGNGLIAQGDPSLKFQYQKLSTKIIEKIMQNLQLMANGSGALEVLVLGGQKFIWDFQTLMRDVFKYNPTPLFVNANGVRGVDSTFEMYKMGGVSLVTAWGPAFDAPWRPQARDIYGVNFESYRGIFVSLGNTIGGTPNVQLTALGNSKGDRSFVKKMITGMVSNGEGTERMFASNSVDGMQCQALWETGIVMRNPFGLAEIYKPYRA